MEDCATLDTHQLAARSLPAVNISLDPIRVSDRPQQDNAALIAELKVLIDLRQSHETSRASKATRIGHSASSSAADESDDARKLGASAEQETARQRPTVHWRHPRD